jgi:hypothetical protein
LVEQFEAGLAAGRALLETFAALTEDQITPALFKRMEEVRAILQRGAAAAAAVAAQLRACQEDAERVISEPSGGGRTPAAGPAVVDDEDDEAPGRGDEE